MITLLGNPLSGLAGGPHWLPNGWATLGQLLPPGASGSLLRANTFFDGTGVGGAALTLGCWVLFGLALLLVSGRRGPCQAAQKSRPPKPSSSPTPDQHGYDEGVGLNGARPLLNCTLEESASVR